MMHDHLTESVGRAMMTRRLERHISQAELARAMGLNQSDVSEIESGRKTCHVSAYGQSGTMRRLASMGGEKWK